ncbi:MAG: hypothetical protein H7177_11680 [Rhizobacter sp.]|nr:hypothetical protein [Bacteriovorax sp.]
MKLLIVICALLASVSVFAGDRNTAYEVICKPMSFESDRTRCVAAIKPHNYYNDDALQICTIFTFDSTKIECLGYIADKTYEAYEIDTCRNGTFDSDKLQCLRTNGQNNGGQSCIPKQELLNQLRQTQNELHQGQTGTVDKRLTYLISRISNCQ